MERTIDLNADVGEKPEFLDDGREEELLRSVSSANIACGGHAGTPASMRAVIAIALRHGVAVGAHPGYPDPEHFGRVAIDMASDALERSIREQVEALVAEARSQGTRVRHVKPHGALYNRAATDPQLAVAIGRALLSWRQAVTLVGLAGSHMLEAWRQMGFRVAAEAFADRRYEPDGTLRSRQYPDALVTDAGEAAERAIDIVVHRRVRSVTGSMVPVHAESLCVHGDSADAIVIVRSIRRALERHGVAIRAVG